MKKPVRIFKLIHHLRAGGAERVFTSLAQLLQRSGSYEVFAGVLEGGGIFEKELHDAGIPLTVFKKKPLFNFDISLQLHHILKEQHIDILHMHEFSAALWGRLSSMGKKSPIRIITDHAVAGWKNPWKHKIINNVLKRHTDSIVALSKTARAALINGEGIPEKLITIIPNGIDFDAIDTECEKSNRRQCKPERNVPHFVVIGRYSMEKGGDIFIEAAHVLHQKNIHFRAELIGDGPMRERYEELIAQFSLEEKVFLTGVLPHKKVLEKIRTFQIGIAPSREDNCSMAVLELMACGIPVIATDVGGNSEIVSHEKTGLIVPPENPVALAEALERLIQDRATRNKMGEKGKSRVKEHFSHQSMLGAYSSLYEQLLERG